MAAPSKVWTREEVLALQDAAPDGVRYELILPALFEEALGGPAYGDDG